MGPEKPVAPNRIKTKIIKIQSNSNYWSVLISNQNSLCEKIYFYNLLLKKNLYLLAINFSDLDFLVDLFGQLLPRIPYCLGTRKNQLHLLVQVVPDHQKNQLILGNLVAQEIRCFQKVQPHLIIKHRLNELVVDIKSFFF